MSDVKRYKKDFLNYLEGTLSDEARVKFEAALSNDAALQAELDAYRRIVLMEQKVAKEEFELDERFVSKVMAEVGRPSFIRRTIMTFVKALKDSTFGMLIGIGALALISTLIVLSSEYPSAVWIDQLLGSLFDFLESGFGAAFVLGLLAAAILFSVKGRFRTAGTFVSCGLACFLLRNTTGTYFNDSSIAVQTGPHELVGEYGAGRSTSSQRQDLESDSLTAPYSDLRNDKKQNSVKVRALEPVAVVPASKEELSNQATIGGSLQKLEGQKPKALGERFASEVAPQAPPMRNRAEDAARVRKSMGLADGYAAPGTQNETSYGYVIPRPIPVPPPAVSGERYYEVSENAPVLTATEPMSTFSIDVDTGSYTNARRYLQSGQFPPTESVRIEEFINYFQYDYPTQSKQPFAANFEVAPSLDGDGTYLLKIGIKAKESGFDGSEKPWNLVFLIDVSGSMASSDKLPLVQRSLELLVQKMRAGDKVSIVTYAGNAGLLLPPTGIEERSLILSAIRSIGAGGSTHGSDGIMQAYEQARAAFVEGGVNRVILATDGDFNVGVTNRDALVKLIEEQRRSGITLTTLGFGTGNYNEATMEQLANKGNGNYFYIDGYREARKVFETDLYGTIEVVAKDVKLQIEFNPEHVAQYRLVGYENRKLKNEDFANDRIDAGEIGAGHTVTAMYELVLTGSEAAKRINPTYRYKKVEETKPAVTESNFSGELAFLKIRYKQPEGERSSLLTFPLKRGEVKSDLKEASADFRFAAAVSAFAHKLRASQYAPTLSFSQIVDIASSARGEDTKGYRQEFIELVRNAAAARGGNE
ncbi:MAG: VWA domain-containing protein [Bdellovibrionales bacterium]|nr:VWA domain-containing protein [Bdellovibrionales bacterium]